MGMGAGAHDPLDVRAAARLAARRSGVTLGQWFDEALRSRAALLGLPVAELGADDRVEAVMARLRASTNPLMEPAEPGKLRAGVVPNNKQRDAPGLIRADANDDGEEPVMQVMARRREQDEHDGEDAPVITSSAPRVLPEEQATDSALAHAGSRQAAQRVEIESKLNALFKALDRTPRRAALDAIEDETDDHRRERLLGETAISPSWRLDKAVSEIAERQAFLDRQAGIGKEAPARPAAEESSSGPREASAKMRRPFAPAAAPVLSDFASLQDHMARLAGTLEAVQLDVSRWPGAAQRQPTLDDMRAMLAEVRPEATLDALHRSVEQLSARLDAHAAPDGQAAAVERLSRRIEEVHAEVTEQLTAARPVLDTAEVERLVAEVVARSPAARGTAPDLTGLESAVQDLAGKLAAVERSGDNGTLLLEMQAQVTRLAERMDRTDAGLTAIVAVERSLGEIVSQVGDMKAVAVSAAATAGRAAAEEAVRAVLPHLTAERGAGESAGAGLSEDVTHSLAEMRAERAKADERLHSILGALNTSLERVVTRLEVLEQGGIEPASSAIPVGPVTLPVIDLPPGVPARGEPEGEAKLGVAEPITWATSSHSAAFEPGEPLDLDLPLEPGTRPGSVAGQAATPAAAPSAPDPSTFIAAARRAAQNAAQEQASRLDAAAAVRKADGVAPGEPQRSSALLRRRPLLLALAGLLLLAGAAQIARMSLLSPKADTGAVEDVTGSLPVVPPTVAAPTDRDAVRPDTDGKTSSAAPVDAAPAPEKAASAEQAPANVASAAPAEAAPQQALPTMAMGPLASVAALKAADASAKLGAAPGIPVGLQQLADAGRADAQYEVGLRYAEGRRVPRDMKMAASWMQKAADQGLAPAAYRLGSLYEKGLGVTRDPASSMSWYRKAADAGSVRAMHNLAVMLAEGAVGKADYPQAASWFTRAADAGVRDSQYNLAILFARGLGVAQDLNQSYRWFSIAAAQGDVDSAKKRDEVAARMDATALATAKDAATAFKPTPTIAAANDVKPPQGGWDAVMPRTPATAMPAAPSGNAHLSRL